MPRRKREPKREKRRKAPTTGENLLGEPCTHVFDREKRWRGYLMCQQPMCAALCNFDGTALTNAQRKALAQQMRKEQGD